MKMTPRQSECYGLMQCGLMASEIAVVMNITKGAARQHRQAVNGKIGLQERDRLAARASHRYLKFQSAKRAERSLKRIVARCRG